MSASEKPKAESLQEALDEYARACQWEGYLTAAHDDERGRDARREMLGARSDLEAFVLDALVRAQGKWWPNVPPSVLRESLHSDAQRIARAIIEGRDV